MELKAKKDLKDRRISTLLLSVFVACLLSCNVALEKPETIDPIYLDLQKEKKKYEDLVKELYHQRSVNLKKRSYMQDRTLEIKLNKSSLKKLNKRIRKYNQKILYYKIKIKQRLKYARRSYVKAFQKKEKWPDPKEYEFYMRSKKLKEAPRKWNRRTTAFNRTYGEDSSGFPKQEKEGKEEKKEKSAH